MNDIFELSIEEKLSRVNTALSDRNSKLVNLQNEFEQQTAGLREEIGYLETLRSDLNNNADSATAEEVGEVSEAAPLDETQGEG